MMPFSGSNCSQTCCNKVQIWIPHIHILFEPCFEGPHLNRRLTDRLLWRFSTTIVSLKKSLRFIQIHCERKLLHLPVHCLPFSVQFKLAQVDLQLNQIGLTVPPLMQHDQHSKHPTVLELMHITTLFLYSRWYCSSQVDLQVDADGDNDAHADIRLQIGRFSNFFDGLI